MYVFLNTFYTVVNIEATVNCQAQCGRRLKSTGFRMAMHGLQKFLSGETQGK